MSKNNKFKEFLIAYLKPYKISLLLWCGFSIGVLMSVLSVAWTLEVIKFNYARIIAFTFGLMSVLLARPLYKWVK